ncbi:hypothetical protein [Bacillus atrophaeus]|uniref:hypothetical protein n=1 Tax=Bacillus atrophaeus TaxID=1452 RepID=UPI001C123937|nr:hypothetical protein [Bacillus atrophaeus]MBU5262003.1 hypothetical protein [Bacillus atrophaeus]MCY8466435.1 hypothetical protein [Bacillus atrophaeus]MCY8478894.1 hypothetical protein [Bacillus atrophaeus]
MREPNLGIMTRCSVCSCPYWSEDGDTVCSSHECQNIAQEQNEIHCKECDDILDFETFSGLCDACEELESGDELNNGV